MQKFDSKYQTNEHVDYWKWNNGPSNLLRTESRTDGYTDERSLRIDSKYRMKQTAYIYTKIK